MVFVVMSQIVSYKDLTKIPLVNEEEPIPPRKKSDPLMFYKLAIQPYYGYMVQQALFITISSTLLY